MCRVEPGNKGAHIVQSESWRPSDKQSGQEPSQLGTDWIDSGVNHLGLFLGKADSEPFRGLHSQNFLGVPPLSRA